MLLDKRLFDKNFDQWKVIPLYLICWYLGRNFKFLSNSEESHSILCKFPRFYKEVIIKWGKHLSSAATLTSIMACHFIWHNNHSFSNSNLNYVGQLFDTDGKLKSWECIKHQFSLKNNVQFQYL